MYVYRRIDSDNGRLLALVELHSGAESSLWQLVQRQTTSGLAGLPWRHCQSLDGFRYSATT